MENFGKYNNQSIQSRYGVNSNKVQFSVEGIPSLGQPLSGEYHKTKTKDTGFRYI